MTSLRKEFQIATIANDAAQYSEMRRSFEAAGFTEERATFTLFDNTTANRHDPYEVLRQLSGKGSEPYVVLCHQDIRLDLGHGYHQLVSQIAVLNKRYPRWAAAGNAGGGSDTERMLAHLNEPAGQFREPTLPLVARSLDENFLLLRRGAHPFCSPRLHGFHLYGTDVCLNAIARGRSAHIIDFLLTHLSGGNAGTPAFSEARERLIEHWERYFLAGFVRTTCTEFGLTGSKLMRFLLSKRRVREFFLGPLGNPLIHHPLCPSLTGS